MIIIITARFPLNFVPKCSFDNNSALVQVMVWYLLGVLETLLTRMTITMSSIFDIIATYLSQRLI